jgi:hypothetical protein
MNKAKLDESIRKQKAEWMRPEAISWAPEVIADSSGKWCGNAVRFATKEEAEADVRDLANRWFMVRETRVVESTDPVNFKRVRGVSVTIDSTD